MGVTLERVQNKFACIIGELSSEPYILSQFAIWVDLRIAEYKSKGAISLECLGCKPDPIWLIGLGDPIDGSQDPCADPVGLEFQTSTCEENVHIQPENSHGLDFLHSPSSVTKKEETTDTDKSGLISIQNKVRLKTALKDNSHPTSDTSEEQDIGLISGQNTAVIKTEPPDVTPIALFEHQNITSENKRTLERKNNFIETFDEESSPCKSRKLSSSSERQFEENQSLLSLIEWTDQPSVTDVFGVTNGPVENETDRMVKKTRSSKTRNISPLSQRSKQIRRFPQAWLGQFPWMQFNAAENCMLCSLCKSAGSLGIWSTGTRNFRMKTVMHHVKSREHKRAMGDFDSKKAIS